MLPIQLQLGRNHFSSSFQPAFEHLASNIMMTNRGIFVRGIGIESLYLINGFIFVIPQERLEQGLWFVDAKGDNIGGTDVENLVLETLRFASSLLRL